jgi:RecA/RadA recombinase
MARRPKVEAPAEVEAEVPAPPPNPRLKAFRALADGLKGWRPASVEFRPVRAVPTIFPALDRATRVGGYPLDRFAIVHGPSAHGKALANGTPVLTPTGWTPIDELMMGEMVIGTDGDWYPVEGVYPQGEKDLYRVTFDDGAEVECCLEHLWFTTTMRQRLRGKFARGPRPDRKRIPTGIEGGGSVKSLAEILEGFEPAQHAVPTIAPAKFSGGALPLDPYALGLLLGDGGFSQRRDVRFHKPEIDLVERLGAALPTGDYLIRDNAITVRIVAGKVGKSRGSRTSMLLEELGLMGHKSPSKFIPELYLLGSIAERTSLLRGLMDTDGSVTNEGGAVDFSTSSPRLAKDVTFLVRSLGGRATPSERESHYTIGGVRYGALPSIRIHISFDNGIVPVSSAKHMAKWKGRNYRGGKMRHRTMMSISFSRRSLATCISVGSPDRLFVAKDFLVTHNTQLALGLGFSFLKEGHVFGYVDAEMTTPPDWLASLMGDYARHPGFLGLRPKSYEQTVDAVRELVHRIADMRDAEEFPEGTSALIVVDSLAKLVPEDFLAKIKKLGAQGEKGSVDGMGGRGGMILAKMHSEWLRELVPLLYHTGTTMLAIAREMENSDPNGRDFKMAGGNAPLFDSSLAMRVTRQWVKEGTGAEATVVGERHEVEVYKSKIGGRDDKSSWAAFHTSNGAITPEGFDRARDVLELAREFGMVETSGSWLSWKGKGKRWQGANSAVAKLNEDPAMLAEMEAQVRAGFATEKPAA